MIHSCRCFARVRASFREFLGAKHVCVTMSTVTKFLGAVDDIAPQDVVLKSALEVLEAAKILHLGGDDGNYWL